MGLSRTLRAIAVLALQASAQTVQLGAVILRDIHQNRWSAVPAIAVVVYTAFAILQWQTMNEQLKVARDEFLANHRPWVEITKAEAISALIFDEQGAYVDLSLHVKNPGTSPAKYAWLDTNFFVSVATTDIISIQRAVCTSSVRGNANIASKGTSLFPGSEGEMRHHARLKMAEVAKLKARSEANHVTILHIGCIVYDFEFGNRSGHTGFIFEIDRLVPATSDATYRFELVDPARGNIPRELVAIAINPSLPAYAD